MTTTTRARPPSPWASRLPYSTSLSHLPQLLCHSLVIGDADSLSPDMSLSRRPHLASTMFQSGLGISPKPAPAPNLHTKWPHRPLAGFPTSPPSCQFPAYPLGCQPPDILPLTPSPNPRAPPDSSSSLLGSCHGFLDSVSVLDQMMACLGQPTSLFFNPSLSPKSQTSRVPPYQPHKGRTLSMLTT